MQLDMENGIVRVTICYGCASGMVDNLTRYYLLCRRLRNVWRYFKGEEKISQVSEIRWVHFNDVSSLPMKTVCVQCFSLVC